MNDVDAAIELINAKTGGAQFRVGLILGSGLGALADAVEDATVIPYDDLPGFPTTGVVGHEGCLLLGHLAGIPVAVLQGRAHYYESGQADVMKIPVRTMAHLGCESLLLTNAAGSLEPDIGPRSVMLITDHINFTGVSPLFGDRGNDRFVDLAGAYDADLAERLRDAARRERIPLPEGVYMWFSGPHYETAAEVRAARMLGANAVGMSTVPEVILARQAGMRVAALSIITNLATGIAEAPLTHTAVVENAAAAATTVQRLLLAFFAALDGQER